MALLLSLFWAPCFCSLLFPLLTVSLFFFLWPDELNVKRADRYMTTAASASRSRADCRWAGFSSLNRLTWFLPCRSQWLGNSHYIMWASAGCVWWAVPAAIHRYCTGPSPLIHGHITQEMGRLCLRLFMTIKSSAFCFCLIFHQKRGRFVWKYLS